MGLEIGGVRCEKAGSTERVVQKVPYAEAVKRVVEEDGDRVRDPEGILVNRQRPIERDGNNMCFSKVGFLAFIPMVVNSTAEMECKSQKIGCGGSYRELLGIVRFYCRRVVGGVDW